jgi:hypothetical protein
MPWYKPRLPVTTGILKPAFQMSPETWARVETQYRYKIPDSIRERIGDAIVRYLWLVQMEHEAPPLTSARDIISAAYKDAEGLGKHLRATVRQLKAIQSCDSDGHALVGHLLRQRVKLPNRKPLRDHLAELVRDLEIFVGDVEILNAALFDAEANVQTAGYQQKGQAWNAWVRSLRVILKEADLPLGINRDNDATPAPFVRLVYQLQAACPQGKWSFKDERALALAMYRAIHTSPARS